jgi:SAM-dependent methyltransferase
MHTPTVADYRKQPGLVRDVNRLWASVYPWLARQVAEFCPSPPGRILEVGCFSGGVGRELLRVFPRACLSVALDMPELADTFIQDWPGCDESRLTLIRTGLERLGVADKSFDLVFCRGAFFFFDDEASIIHELERVRAAGGIAVFGGGYGCYTPDHVISPIAEESRIKNNALGRRLYRVEDVRRLLERSGLAARICEGGGLWVVMKE